MQYVARFSGRMMAANVGETLRRLVRPRPSTGALLALTLALSGCANLVPIARETPSAVAYPSQPLKPPAPSSLRDPGSAYRQDLPGTRQAAQAAGATSDATIPINRVPVAPLTSASPTTGAGVPTVVPTQILEVPNPAAPNPAAPIAAAAIPAAAPPAAAIPDAAIATAPPRLDPGVTPALTGTPETLPALPADTNLWDRIRSGFALPPLPTPLVAEKERFYTAKPDYLQRMFERGSRYLFHIVEELEKRNMPTELALLPFVESAMNPVALSSARASGLWQFIPSTGKAYDLQQDWWVDNRRDVVKSTQAALDYLQKIYTMHGNDWFLALASYNWGEGSVARAIKKNQALGRPTDYLSLQMPNETRHYVPKLLALKNLLLNADSLGLKLPDLPNRPYFVTIEKTRPIDLQLAAKFAQMSVEEFVALNPAHNRPVISPGSNNEIKLPADRLDQYKAAMASHEADSKAFTTWHPYTLKRGETLDAIAQRSGVSVAELRRANGLRDGARIMAGTRLLTPQSGIADDRTVEQFQGPRIYEQVERPAVYHTVAPRETLASIASRYRISTATLAAWNGLRKGVAKGMRLLVQPAGTQTMLTAENGNRSVIGQTNTPPTAVDMPAPSAGTPKPERATAGTAARAIKVSAATPRKASATDKAPRNADRSARKDPTARATRTPPPGKPATRTASDRPDPKV